MQLFTTVSLPTPPLRIEDGDVVFTLGSCFAQNVGEQLQHRMGEDMVCVNPFGVLYNPVSIHQALALLVSERHGEEAVNASVFKGRDGMYHSWLFSGRFSSKQREICVESITKSLRQAREMMSRTRLLCITFGTTRCYRLREGSRCVVANCHKELPSVFVEEDPAADALKAEWGTLMKRLSQTFPEMKVCLTVSPYRYRKYGFHESQLQKSKLLLLADAIEKEFGNAFYFPSYEIMLDELRDYRFYAADMLHPSEQAVQLITERFAEWVFSDILKRRSAENLKLWRQSQHIPISG